MVNIMINMTTDNLDDVQHLPVSTSCSTPEHGVLGHVVKLEPTNKRDSCISLSFNIAFRDTCVVLKKDEAELEGLNPLQALADKSNLQLGPRCTTLEVLPIIRLSL